MENMNEDDDNQIIIHNEPQPFFMEIERMNPRNCDFFETGDSEDEIYHNQLMNQTHYSFLRWQQGNGDEMPSLEMLQIEILRRQQENGDDMPILETPFNEKMNPSHYLFQGGQQGNGDEMPLPPLEFVHY